jgi:hypothetical protein
MDTKRNDPCLFLKAGMMYVVYVDDTIFASSSVNNLEREITSLGINFSVQRHTFALQNEGEVCAFLGIHIKKIKDNEFLRTQSGLTDKVLCHRNDRLHNRSKWSSSSQRRGFSFRACAAHHHDNTSAVTSERFRHKSSDIGHRSFLQ